MVTKITVESDETVEVNGVAIPPSAGPAAPTPPAGDDDGVIRYTELTGKEFPNSNNGQNYVLPVLPAQFCRVQIRHAGEVIAKGSSATNTRIMHNFEAGKTYRMVITGKKDGKRLDLIYGGAPENGYVNFGLITGTGTMSLNIKTGQ